MSPRLVSNWLIAIMAALGAATAVFAFSETPASAQSSTPPKPENVRVYHNDVAANFSWDDPSTDGLTFRVWLEGPDLPICETADYWGNCVLTPLEPSTSYVAHVYAEDESGNRSGDATITFTTDTKVERPSDAKNVSYSFKDNQLVLVKWESLGGGPETYQAAAWDADETEIGSCSVTTYYNPDFKPECEAATEGEAHFVGVRSCNFRGRNVPGLLEPACSDYKIERIPRAIELPLTPVDVSANIEKTAATIAWTHPGGTAERYTVELRGAAAGASSCEVDAPFGTFESCRLEGLTPGTDYQAALFAENADGGKSQMAFLQFRTLSKDGTRPPNPCAEGGKDFKKKQNRIRVAEKKFDKAVEKWTDRLEDRPRKLAKRIRRLVNLRDRRISRANSEFAQACGSPSCSSESNNTAATDSRPPC